MLQAGGDRLGPACMCKKPAMHTEAQRQLQSVTVAAAAAAPLPVPTPLALPQHGSM